MLKQMRWLSYLEFTLGLSKARFLDELRELSLVHHSEPTGKSPELSEIHIIQMITESPHVQDEHEG